MSFVYFIRPVGADGPVKIGCSQSPRERLGALMKYSPVPLEIVAEIKGKHGLEQKFHTMFAAQWSHCEWFNASPELTLTIEQLRLGAFDRSTLPDIGQRISHRQYLSTRKARNAALRDAALSEANGLRSAA